MCLVLAATSILANAGQLLLVGTAEIDPVPRLLEHGLQVLDAAKVVVQNSTADGTDQNIAVATQFEYKVV